ncbi:MAG: ABC transporter ATP-binding protein [Actinobacteria bacterium]|nr:ABC transporter ATP-binding protein [Actinomycetota bacterium]
MSTVAAPPLPGLRPGLDDALLRVEAVTKTFTSGGSRLARRPPLQVHAVSELSFDVRRGETFGLVGESGCGKSTAARCILRLVEPTAGRVVLGDVDVGSLDREALRRLRRNAQIVFQDSTASLNSRMSVRSIVREPLDIHGIGTPEERDALVAETLGLVGIAPEQVDRKPHAFSGGQRQRIGIARALVLHPELLVLDEPVSAVDVSLQAQILNLLRELQERLGLTYLVIVHDLAVAEYFCDRLAVLYLGRVMEIGDREQLFESPLHPYTVSLLAAAPVPDPAVESRRKRIILRGEAQETPDMSVGCAFRARCPIGADRPVCASERPPLAESETGHWHACHFPGELTTATSKKE